jgi:hypothetical protein
MNIITDESKKLHPYVAKNGVLFAQSQLESFPAKVNELEGYRRINSKSALNTSGPITDGSMVDILIEGDNGGYAHSLIVEIKLRELGNLSPATICTNLIFQRVEVYMNGSKKLFHTMYPFEFGLLEYLTIPFEEMRKSRLALGLQANYTPIVGNLPQNSIKTFFIKIPLFKGSQIDFRNILGGVNFRFIFNAPSVFCDSAQSTDVGLSDINIVLRQLNINHIRPSKTLRHKFINYIRNSQQISNMTASQEYDIKLNSLRGFCSHLVIVVRENPVDTSYVNSNTYLGNISEINFADASNKRQAIPFTKDFNSMIMCENLNSDFIVSHPTGENVWILSFNMVPSSACHGVFYGNYLLTTNEHIYLKTNSSFATTNCIIDVFGAQMGYFDVEPNGEFSYST